MSTNWVSELAALSSASPSVNDAPSVHWAEDVRAFWFEDLEPADWFKKSDATDARIASRYLTLYKSLSEMPVDALAASSPVEVLAAVIVLDQFPRNLFRGDPLSFATDAKALAIAKVAIDGGLDQDLSVSQRVFLYLPFEHSEDMADQDRSVELISALGDEGYTQYALAHRDVISRFGRFPHRNAVLGRTSTDEEQEYLATPGSGF
jgi:uncharacterized protein (DUF924 family)